MQKRNSHETSQETKVVRAFGCCAGAILALAAAGAFLLSFDVNLAGLDISSMAAVVSSIATALLINSGDE